MNHEAVNVAFAKVNDIAHNIQKMYCRGRPSTVAWHAMIVHPGSPTQEVHVDDEKFVRNKRCYYTLIIPLTNNPQAGGTYFPQLGFVFCAFGGALMFDGAVEHAGLGNPSNANRVFLYAAIHSGKDEN